MFMSMVVSMVVVVGVRGGGGRRRRHELQRHGAQRLHVDLVGDVAAIGLGPAHRRRALAYINPARRRLSAMVRTSVLVRYGTVPSS